MTNPNHSQASIAGSTRAKPLEKVIEMMMPMKATSVRIIAITPEFLDRGMPADDSPLTIVTADTRVFHC